VHRVGLQIGIGIALRGTRVAHDVQDRGGIRDIERRSRSAQDLKDRLTRVWCERIDVDQRLDAGVTKLGVGDHEAAIGVADEDHWTARPLLDE
jgi:hypothetical protein